MKAKRC